MHSVQQQICLQMQHSAYFLPVFLTCLLLGLFASKEGFGACHFPAYKLFLVLVSCFQTVVLLGGLEDESLRPKQEVVRWVGWILLKVLFLLKWPSNFKMFMNQQPTHLPVAPFPLKSYSIMPPQLYL